MSESEYMYFTECEKYGIYIPHSIQRDLKLL